MWKTMKLDDIATLSLGKTPSRSNPKFWDKEKNSKNIWLSIADLSASNQLYIEDSKEYVSDEGAKLFREVPEETLIMSFKLSIGKLAITKCSLRTNEAIIAMPIKDKKLIMKEYLYYYLSSMNWDAIAGKDIKVKGKTLNKTKLKELPILVPPLAEQERIVAKLDAAFAEIDEAIKVAEQNAKNADDILERSIPKIITKNSSEIVTCTLGSAFSLSSGKLLSKKDMVNDGKINVYGGNGITGKHNAYNLQGKNILIGRVGAKCGNVHYVDESLWLTDNAMYAHTFNYEFNLEFISLLLSKLNLGKYARQAAQPVISFSSIKDIIISFPKDLREQKKIIKSVLNIENHTRSLTKLHEYRQDNYNVLKAAILSQELQSSEAA